MGLEKKVEIFQTDPWRICNLQIPLCVIVAWTMGVDMDLNFNLMETGSLGLAIIATAFTLQDGTSHYIKGLVLLLCYIIIAACFFVSKTQEGDHFFPLFFKILHTLGGFRWRVWDIVWITRIKNELRKSKRMFESGFEIVKIIVIFKITLNML